MKKTPIFLFTLKASLFVGMLIWALACNNRKEVETLEKATMDIHDEAMKGMGAMNAVARDIRKELQTTDSLAPRYQQLLEATTRIEHAESDMMAWMQGYEAPADDMPVEKALAYLKDQKAKMEKNKADIAEATEKGKALLQK